jgi:glycosyltransferase involved in cell wall biosynthesis
VVAQNLSDPVKNVGLAVEVFRELKKIYPHISLALVGKNGDAFMGEGVTGLGSLAAEEIAQTLSQSSGLIVPSLAENSPLVIAEAAARGTPSIVNSVGGMPDMVTALGAGSVFSNDAELHESMALVAENDHPASPASRQGLSDRARKLFSPASVSQQYDDLYSV